VPRLTFLAASQAYGTCHATPGRSLADATSSVDRAGPRLVKLATTVLIVSLLSSLALGVAFVKLAQHNSQALVRLSVAVQVAAPLVLATLMFTVGNGSAWFFLFLAALSALVFYLWRRQLELVGKLLGVAGRALSENAHLVSVSLLLSFVALANSVPIVVLMILATRVGKAVPLSGAVQSTANAITCMDAGSGTPVDCCAFEMAPAAIAYIAFASTVVSWVGFSFAEARLFITAHVTGSWYWSAAGTRLKGNPVRTATALAFGPSAGSLSLGGAVLTLADMLRKAAEQGNGSGESFVACIAKMMMSCLASLLEAITRFATVRVALTGEAFFDAARGAIDLLTRNMLNTYAVWNFLPTILFTTSFALSACTSGLAALAFRGLGQHTATVAKASGDTGAIDALKIGTIVVAVIAFVFALATLMFISGILTSVVDTIYVCWATDVDRSLMSRPEVHAIYVLLPVRTDGAVVQQPDGELGYAPGNPQTVPPPPQPQYYATQQTAQPQYHPAMYAQQPQWQQQQQPQWQQAQPQWQQQSSKQ